jgi:hypothetical protein
MKTDEFIHEAYEDTYIENTHSHFKLFFSSSETSLIKRNVKYVGQSVVFALLDTTTPWSKPYASPWPLKNVGVKLYQVRNCVRIHSQFIWKRSQ